MIKLLTRDLYYTFIGKKPGEIEYRRFSNIEYPEGYPRNLAMWDHNFVYYYLDETETVFVLLPKLKEILVPLNPKYDAVDVYNTIKGSVFTLSNWKLDYTGQISKHEYLLNTLKKSYGTLEIEMEVGDRLSSGKFLEGTYTISNEDFPGFKPIKMLSYYRKDSILNWVENLMSFEGKDDPDIPKKQKIEIENLITLVFNDGNGKYYKRTDIKS